MTEIFLTVLAPKRKVEYQKGPFSEHFSPSTLQKAKNITLRHYLSHNYAYFLHNNLYKKSRATRVKRRSKRRTGAHNENKARTATKTRSSALLSSAPGNTVLR